MLDLFKKLRYGVRVMLSRKGEPETLDLAGRPVSIITGGNGPAFVYLHSTAGESFRWFPFHDLWAKHFTVYAPMHPGFGGTGGFDQIDTIEDMAFHYVELFDALGLGEVILGGVSLGGWIAAEFACRWPERVKKLWISGSPGLWVEEQPLPDFFRYLSDVPKMRQFLFADPESYIAKMAMPDEPDDERRQVGYQNMTVLARLVWQRPYNPKLAARLRRVACPTLLLWGDRDALVPPAYGREYAKYLVNSTFQTIPNCGHLAMFEREAEFVEAISRFCRD